MGSSYFRSLFLEERRCVRDLSDGCSRAYNAGISYSPECVTVTACRDATEVVYLTLSYTVPHYLDNR